MAKTPGVKKVWPVHHYPRPDVKFTSLPPGATFRHDLASIDNDTYSPHVMMQVDQLRALGVTGKGIQVALIDDG
ncbi:hypothetical protein E4U43_006606, partial [Claviceps pusilla]